MIIYHYCARKDDMYFDGILKTDNLIDSYDDYMDVKKSIAKNSEISCYEKITIYSLTILRRQK